MYLYAAAEIKNALSIDHKEDCGQDSYGIANLV
jgi:hypothetical protein